MNVRRVRVLAVGTLLIAAGGEAWLFSNRVELAPGDTADYDELYVPAAAPRIVGMDVSGDTIALRLRGGADWRGPADWEQNVQFALQNGTHEYTADLSGFAAEYDLRARIKKQRGETVLVEANVPVADTARYVPMSHWADGHWESSSPEFIARARDRLAGLDLPASATTLERIDGVANLVGGAMEPFHGPPSPAMSRLRGLEAFESVQAGDSTIWCDNIAKMYAAYANLAGIGTRIVHAMAVYDGVTLTAHTFNESFVPEQGRWAFVDLTSGQAYLTGEDGKVLNAWQLFLAWQQDDGYAPKPKYIETQESYGFRNFDMFFDRHAKFYYTTALHQSPSKLERGVAYFAEPKRIAALNPSSVLLYSWLRRGLLVLGAMALVVLMATLFARKQRSRATKS